MNSKTSIIQGVFWKFGERILAQGISFFVSVVLSRILLPSDYGTVALVLVFINIADVFVTSGFSTALVQNKNASELDFSTNFYCSFVLSLVVYGIVFGAAPYIADFYQMPELKTILRVFSLRIPISSFSAIQHAYVERNMLFKKYFFSTLLGTIVSGIVGITMALMKFGVWALVFQYFTNTIIDIIILFITVPWRPHFLFSIESAKSMISYGWKILASDLSGTLFDQLRSLMTGKAYSSSDLAYYNKGKQLPDLISVNVCATLMTVLFPAISNVNDSIEEVKTITHKALVLSSYIMFPLLLGLVGIAEPLVKFLYTDKWMNAIIYIQILCVASMINMSSSVSLQVIKALGRSDVILKMEFVKKTIYIILLFIGIHSGPLYVAITMAIYNIFECFMNSVSLAKVGQYSLKNQVSDVIGHLFMSVIMLLVIFPLSNLKFSPLLILILQITCGIFVYSILSIITRDYAFIYLYKTLTKFIKNK